MGQEKQGARMAPSSYPKFISNPTPSFYLLCQNLSPHLLSAILLKSPLHQVPWFSSCLTAIPTSLHPLKPNKLLPNLAVCPAWNIPHPLFIWLSPTHASDLHFKVTFPEFWPTPIPVEPDSYLITFSPSNHHNLQVSIDLWTCLHLCLLCGETVVFRRSETLPFIHHTVLETHHAASNTVVAQYYLPDWTLTNKVKLPKRRFFLHRWKRFGGRWKNHAAFYNWNYGQLHGMGTDPDLSCHLPTDPFRKMTSPPWASVFFLSMRTTNSFLSHW